MRPDGRRAAAASRLVAPGGRGREDEHRVHPAEAEGVRHRGANARDLAADVGHVQQPERRIGLVEARGRHDRASRDDERGDDGLDRPGGAERVPDLGLAARDGHAADVVAERSAQRGGLHSVVGQRPRAVRVDVVDVARTHPALDRARAR